MNWFEAHRIEWIAETLRIFGFINRRHLEIKFGISTQQASHDIKVFTDRNPGSITYDKTSKCYRAAQNTTERCYCDDHQGTNMRCPTHGTR